MTDDVAGGDSHFDDLLRQLATLLDRRKSDEGWRSDLMRGVAGGLKSAGEFDSADRLFQQILKDDPEQLWPWIGRIEIAMERGNVIDAVSLGRDALKHLPQHPLILRKAAEAQAAHQGAASAVAFLQEAGGLGLDDPDLNACAIQYFRAAGQVTGAASLVSRVLSGDPAHMLALLARIEIALIQRALEAAVSAGRAAISAHPDHPEIRVRAAQAFLMAGQPQAARTCLAGLPADAGFEAERADILNKAQQQVATAPLVETDGGRGGSAGVAGDDAAAGLARALAAIQSRDERAPTDIALRLDALVPAVPAASWTDLWRAWQLAVTHGAEKLIHAAVARFLSGDDLPWYMGVWLVEQVTEGADLGLAQDLSDQLQGTIRNPEERRAFLLEDALLRGGPRAALRMVRADPVAGRDAEAAERVLRILSGAGLCDLAYRYGRRCTRVWPDHISLSDQAAKAALAAGLVDAALDMLPETRSATIGSRFSVLLSAGKIPQASILLADWPQDAAARPGCADQLELHVLAGNLSAAETTLGRIDPQRDVDDAILVTNPRSTRVGTLLNEARIMARIVGGGGDPVGIPEDREPVADLFLPARAVVAARLSTGPVMAPCADEADLDPRPMEAIQVWPGTPPLEIRHIVEAWAGVPNITHRLMSHDQGRDYLRANFDQDASRAFELATEVQQRSDMLRLAIMLREGGIALEMNQVPARGVSGLLRDVRCARVFVDPRGHIVTDVYAAPPRHPLIQRAFDLVVASGLARENDHRWFRTGPGLMTRAVALQLLESEDPEEAGIAICPVSRLRRFVQPHRDLDKFLPDPGRASFPGAAVDAIRMALQ